MVQYSQPSGDGVPGAIKNARGSFADSDRVAAARVSIKGRSAESVSGSAPGSPAGSSSVVSV